MKDENQMAVIEMSAKIEGRSEAEAGARMTFSCSALCRGRGGTLPSKEEEGDESKAQTSPNGS